MKKKRAAKVLALALLLGLCLWLTGCYIPPDQITDDAQNMTIGANNLPFNTRVPTEAPATATPTPNPVVSNTDGIDIGSNTGSGPTATVDWNAGWGPTENGTDTPHRANPHDSARVFGARGAYMALPARARGEWRGGLAEL